MDGAYFIVAIVGREKAMNASVSRIRASIQSASMIKGRELNAVISSFLLVVVLMSAYYILRPVRDAMASDWTDAEVSWLWTLNFFISTGVVLYTAPRYHDFGSSYLFPRPMAFSLHRSCHFTRWVFSTPTAR